jgi:hypothetical protein
MFYSLISITIFYFFTKDPKLLGFTPTLVESYDMSVAKECCLPLVSLIQFFDLL